jgi:hypothetical protein
LIVRIKPINNKEAIKELLAYKPFRTEIIDDLKENKDRDAITEKEIIKAIKETFSYKNLGLYNNLPNDRICYYINSSEALYKIIPDKFFETIRKIKDVINCSDASSMETDNMICITYHYGKK